MIEVTALTRTYGGLLAVDDVTFTAQPGRVTGFLGPNGAGKSTTMRVMVGLTPPTSGSATVLGRRYADLPNPGREVGVLLDASAQHAGRTGRETLRIAARTMGLPMSRVDEMLETVSLTPTEAGRRVKNYSLGMRQRLGIATALIGDPEVLILDEPANGLDPAGIRWMRDLLPGFANKGGTVLLSSHLLHEIEVIADDLVVIGQGRIVAQGTKAELLASAGTLVRSSAIAELAQALEPHPASTPSPPATTRCAPTPRPTRSARSPSPPAYPSPSCAPPTAPASRRCSSSSPQTTVPRRSSSMTATTARPRPHPAPGWPGAAPAPIPFTRVLWVELTKMFDTRPGFWLMVGIAATRADRDRCGDRRSRPTAQLTYDSFGAAIGIPMALLLPIMAILSVTSEWSQRSGLTTFTLVPHRGRVIRAKMIVSMALGAVSIGVALAIGALGNVVGAAIAGVDTVWDISVNQALSLVLANVLNLLIGFMLGVLIRNSPGAIVGLLRLLRSCCRRCRCCWREFQQLVGGPPAWLDFNWAQGELYDGSLTGREWAHLGVSGVIWLVIPLAVGLVMVMRSEVK